MTAELLTFGQTLDYFAEQNPDEIVLQCAQQDGSLTATSRGDLTIQSDAIARQLIVLGVNTGDLVPIILPTSVDFLIAATGIFKAGGTPMPVSHKLPTSERDRLLELAQPKAVFSKCDCGYTRVSIHPASDCSEGASIHPPRISDPIKALASGGSTGKPKLILTRGPYQAALGENLIGQTLRFRAGDLKFSPGPCITMDHSGFRSTCS